MFDLKLLQIMEWCYVYIISKTKSISFMLYQHLTVILMYINMSTITSDIFTMSHKIETEKVIHHAIKIHINVT